jgi:signal transduction histidine kinase
VLAEARYRGLTIFAVALLGTLLSTLVVMLTYSGRQRRLDREMLEAERGRRHALQEVAEGEARLRQLNEELERLVEERTRELADARDVAESSNRVKDIFLATMSHELRTPLNSIIGFSDILLGGLAGELNAEQKTQLGIIHKSGQQLLALIGDVLDISKIEAGQLRLDLARVPLQDLLLEQRRVFELQARERGLALEFEYPPQPIEVVADAQRLRQIIGNLMSNALKFTDRGTVGLRAERQGNRVRITVHDTGVGIAAEDQPNLFKPFRRLVPRQGGSRDGTGLGLAISHRLVRAMGGEMGVWSEPGRGSRFWFTLASG